MKPTKKQIQKWVTALRSGEYSQTNGWLQDDNGHCCLGVACDIFIPDGLKGLQESNGFMRGGMPRTQAHAPEWLRDLRGILGAEISGLNDDGDVSIGEEINEQFEPFTFDEIADLLEYEYIYEVLS